MGLVTDFRKQPPREEAKKEQPSVRRERPKVRTADPMMTPAL